MLLCFCNNPRTGRTLCFKGEQCLPEFGKRFMGTNLVGCNLRVTHSNSYPGYLNCGLRQGLEHSGKGR